MIPIGGFSVPEEFASITARDSVLALSIGRRSSTMRSILQSARLTGAHTVSLTDQVSSGFPDLANVTLRCRTQGLSYFDSVVAPVSVITHLCTIVAKQIGQTAVERLRYIDSIHSEWGGAS
jgi:DNA-binding MurR/RpiR family transcriptional regulator